MTGCNFNTPGWGESLGVVSFYTDNEWIIEGNGITQIWSDAVTANACQKETFNGGNLEVQDFNADCRSNPNFPGDLFSWCAVVRFADTLCSPAQGWRVPRMQDFIDLDIALGGTGESRDFSDENAQFVEVNYINRWGGAFGGFGRSAEGCLWFQSSCGFYWSQSEYDTTLGRSFRFIDSGFVFPQPSKFKGFGFSVRCVR